VLKLTCSNVEIQKFSGGKTSGREVKGEKEGTGGREGRERRGGWEGRGGKEGERGRVRPLSPASMFPGLGSSGICVLSVFVKQQQFN